MQSLLPRRHLAGEPRWMAELAVNPVGELRLISNTQEL